jgi:hypothetical protein
MVAAVSMMAQAADAVLTLTCQGIETSKFEATDQGTTQELMPFGLIVNLTARTVEGFPVSNLPVKVTVANQAAIEFEGSDTSIATVIRRVSGTIDRVTGEAWATFTMGPAVAYFSLKCRPTQRMF